MPALQDDNYYWLKDQMKLVQMLLDAGADPCAKDNVRTPQHPLSPLLFPSHLAMGIGELNLQLSLPVTQSGGR